jgi:hypothetical protein
MIAVGGEEEHRSGRRGHKKGRYAKNASDKDLKKC